MKIIEGILVVFAVCLFALFDRVDELEAFQQKIEKKQPAKIAYIVVKANEKERTVAVDTVFYSFDKAYYYCEAEEEKEENKDCRFHVLQRIIEND